MKLKDLKYIPACRKCDGIMGPVMCGTDEEERWDGVQQGRRSMSAGARIRGGSGKDSFAPNALVLLCQGILPFYAVGMHRVVSVEEA